MTRDDVYTELGLCDCGDPRGALDFVREILALCSSEGGSWARLGEVLKPRETYAGYLVLCMLDRAEYLDHGTTIYCSWRTPKGDEALSALNAPE